MFQEHECEEIEDGGARIGNINIASDLEEMTIDFLSQLCQTGKKTTPSDSRQSSAENFEDSKPVPVARPKIQLQLTDRVKRTTSGECGTKYLTFPRKTSSGSAKPFGEPICFQRHPRNFGFTATTVAQIFKVLSYMHEAVIDGIPATKRDIYYRDVSLFKNQRVVDNLVDDIAASLDLERSDLKIRATAKGTFCGSGLTIHLINGEILSGSDSEASLVPAGEDIESFSVDDDVEWVLVVEKDAVFQTLCHHRLTALTAGKGIMITGKGYPDVATRQLVKTLSDCLPKRIPIMAFMDGDAFGIDILSVYKYGSRAMSHENEKLAANRVKWLGLWSTELSKIGIDKDALIPITVHDEKKALSLLRKNMPTKWRRELNHMLHNRRKAEIEVLTTARSLTIPQSSHLSNITGSASISSSDSSLNLNLAPTSCPALPFSESPNLAARSSGLSPLLQYITFKLREVVSSATRS
ncbi:hypothetical protein E1B28_010136 [Marasmius oreades]|uniref:DNA topoisomerase (ATP-hydrolyzing) n=1 Tax=Marasmius oreades TaxID=181124 RepID=A0A9P7RWL1_9AGAR|nr:uncharacterized protein E1B28_010136 [Marasmius oreades]KAG7091079.1 hypothetical protein E1B28_010136 [Marasmius oreades]